eukprot:TRINITY_DN8307_c0_g1_i1.p1 TRINITY_DN8307_c0_g1~~TRINITY_DN8307_c0_g1_i1.p1  ORF type:complete len:1207 (-),score=184.01 TRINITY_DN8307_c0_g1_i1:797-4417(-)
MEAPTSKPPSDGSAQNREGSANADRPNKSKFAKLTSAKLGTLSISTLETAAEQQNLQVLDLKDNKIAAMPSEIYSAFTQVKVLDLRKNALEELHPDISVMQSLEDLLLDQNRLREVPAEVCSLPNLKTFSLSQNVIRSLPKAIGRMASLRSLSLGDNQVEEIPAELGSCSELQCLYIHHNHFTKLPTSLYQLENLNELALEWFRYTTPPLPRVIKGTEWKRIISKFAGICKERTDRGEKSISCIQVLSTFSQKPFDPNAIDSKRRTRLHVACLEGHVGVAMSLAENGSKCDSLDCEGYSPLLVAVREEHPDIATALVRVGVDVNRGGGLFGSPLHVATVNFDPHMVLLLIHGRADVNQTDADGNTPLHVLMSVFDKGGKKAGAIGQILLRHNADCNLMNSDKWAPLHLAARRGQLRGICFVLSHIDSVDSSCLRGTCTHQPSHKRSKSSRVRTCTRAFDLNLRGGSHLWTPLHLAGHACHVPVVQVLIEAGADVFLRNIDGRTARHVSRGNLAISKLLRKAEDEWLWYRIRQGSGNNALEDIAEGQESEKGLPSAKESPSGSSKAVDESLPENFRVGDEDDDAIEEIAKNIEGLNETTTEGSGGGDGRSLADPGGQSVQRRRHEENRQMYRIIEKCRDMHLTKAELQQLKAANFTVPSEGLDDFFALFTKLTQQGPKNRLPFFMSKPWVKERIPQLLSDERGQRLLLQPTLVNNEDFVRLLICNIGRDKLSVLGKLRNAEKESLFHVICKGSSSKAFPSVATRADILSLLLTVCPPDTFDLEARDVRGQTALHLSAQSGDIGLVQVLLEYSADPNAQEETTGWTPLHFAVAKAHYALIMQLLHHDATNVNQADKFDWPPLLEACYRLDARSTSLLVNGGANLGFRNQHQFDVLKAADTSKKDLAAKRWMSCLVVSNGFRFGESTVQLNQEDRETLERERAFFDTRATPATNPPFFVPDHLAPRCHNCKVLFAVTVRRYHCRSCGLVLCGDCFKWRATNIVALDERVRGRRTVANGALPLTGAVGAGDDEGGAQGAAMNESRLNVAVEMSLRERNVSQGKHPTAYGPPAQGNRMQQSPPAAAPALGGLSAAGKNADSAGLLTNRSEDSFEDPPLAEELPAIGPPMSVICPASMMSGVVDSSVREPRTMKLRRDALGQGKLSREFNSGGTPSASRMVRLCSPCAAFFEAGVGETYAMLQRKEAVTAQI